MLELLYKSMFCALEAGKIVMKFHGEEAHSLKADESPLTQADLESSRFLVESLKLCSELEVCSEESVLPYDKRKELEFYWLIDPLDGTKEFIARKREFTINIALIYSNVPILGAVYAPALNELYFGGKDERGKGFGAFYIKDGLSELDDVAPDVLANPKLAIDSNILQHIDSIKKPMKCDSAPRAQLIACDSVYHSTLATQEFIQAHNMQTLKKGSSLKLCALANGEADIYPRFEGSKEWDTAAGDAILREMGGVILDINTKKPLLYNKPDIKNSHFIAFSPAQVGEKIYMEMLG